MHSRPSTSAFHREEDPSADKKRTAASSWSFSPETAGDYTSGPNHVFCQQAELRVCAAGSLRRLQKVCFRFEAGSGARSRTLHQPRRRWLAQKVSRPLTPVVSR